MAVRPVPERIEFRRDVALDGGSLAAVGLPELLHTCHAGRVSGTLLLRNDPIEKLVYVLDGVPAFVESDLRSETLGAYLLRVGRLTEEDHRRVFEQMRRTGRRQGELLIENGLMSPHELYEALLAHVREKVIACFAWESGTYALERGSDWSHRILNLKLEPSRIILEGIGRHYGEERLTPLPWLPAMTKVYLRPDAPPLVKKLSLTTVEARVYETVSRQRPLVELLALEGADRLAVLRILYGMYVLELVGFSTETGSKTARTSPRTPAPRRVSPAAARAPAEPDRAAAILVDYLKLKEADHYTLLGVDRGADAEAIERAFEVRSALYARDAVSTLPAVAKEKARELHLKLKEAYQVLSSPERRRAYLERLEGTQREPQPRGRGALEGDDLFEAAREALAEGKADVAVDKLRQALAARRGEPLFLVWLGWALYLADPEANRKQAEKQLELARRAQPDMPEPYLFMARLCVREGALDRATGHYEAALDRDRRNLELAKELKKHLARVGGPGSARDAGPKPEKPAPRRERDKPGSAAEGSKGLLDQDVGALFGKIFSPGKKKG